MRIAISKRLLRPAWLCLLLATALAQWTAFAEDYFLFTSFRNNGEDGLHLAISTNGYRWEALNNDHSFLKPELGAKIMRDPCLAEGPDGTFHLVWTCGWTTEKGRIIGYAHSKDLVNWSEQRAIPLMENEPGARNIWAPEIFYEQAQNRWLVFWSSTIPGKFAHTDQTGDSGYNHRIYCATTADFQEFSPSRLLLNPGFNVIDATLFQAGSKYYLFFKDERKQPLKKNLRYAVADQPEGPYGQPSEPFTGDWVEGPSAIRIRDEYLVYFDHYSQPHYYGAVRSKDLQHWEDCSREMSFPKGHRHGTILRVSKQIAQSLAAQASGSAQQPAAKSNRLLVIAPKAFEPALGNFVQDKQKLLPTELRSLESILQDSTGADDPEKLKRFLYREWRERGLGYVLLVGDVDVMPVRFMVLDRVTPAAYDFAFYPSDLYYADLAKADGSFDDWNAQKDSFHAGYYGEVRGEKNKQDPINFDQIDYRPEIAVGRWPVSTPAEVSLVAAKTIACEQNTLTNAGPQCRRAAFIAVGGWVDSRGLLDRLASRLTNTWLVEKRFYSDAGHPSGTPPPDHSQVRGLLNSGVGLVVHAGHGQSDAWEQCFSVRDLDQVTNAPALPVFISAGCSTAYFAPLPPYDGYVDVDGREHNGTDHKEVFSAPPPPPAPYQKGRFNPTGLGEQILKRNANGGVAYIGCNTGSQPCALTLVEGFVEAVAGAREPRLGDCWVSAIAHYYDKEHLATLKPNQDWYPPSIFFQGMKFMLFGDPSLRLPGPSK